MMPRRLSRPGHEVFNIGVSSTTGVDISPQSVVLRMAAGYSSDQTTATVTLRSDVPARIGTDA